MRQIRLVLMALVLLFLTACAQERASVYDVKYKGETYTIDEENQTITFDGTTVRVSWRGSEDDYKVTFFYPDGSVFRWEQSGDGLGTGGWSDSYDPERYVAGTVLLSVWEKAHPGGFHWGTHPLIGLLLILLGAVGTAFPKAMWYLSRGWHYKNAEPSDLSLLSHRLGGVVMAVLGVFLLFV